ncbi:MAG: hypothetical protein AAB332_01850 [Planctomycetota bacterium]
MATEEKLIKYWVRRIESSDLSLGNFFSRYKVPFGRTQYYEYKSKLLGGNWDLDSVVPKKRGRNQKIGEREEYFLRGCLSGGGSPSVTELQGRLAEEMQISVDPTTISRTLSRLFPDYKPQLGRPKNQSPASTVNPLGGFELIIAVAFHLKWHERSGKVITEAICALKRNRVWRDRKVRSDLKGRTLKGQFTKKYNQRADIRASKFASVSDKREGKNWDSMNILRDQASTLFRKNLAILSLPIITSNGHVRTVNLPRGQALDDLCGFNYKQATLNKFLGELKYLGIAERLLKDLPEFWKKCWGKDVMQKQTPALYYYIDGNTKAVWSSQRIKQNKVTMLGRVMGCLEQVFIHDGLGHPIYFETYSGHAPVGEYILSMFEKIESTIMEVPGSKTSVCRAIVMDAASNSVKTLRAFADQDKYHYITTLDDNQWSERRVRNRGYPIRYQHGKATLCDISYELEDSKEKGFLIVVRAIKINWDNGKQTVIITSLPRNSVDANEVVYSYFRRWPAQELIFRGEKSAVSLNRVCGYGRKRVSNDRVKIELEKLAVKKQKIEGDLMKPMATIAAHDKAIAALIPKERRLREQTKIVNGIRKIPKTIRTQFVDVQEKILAHNKEKKRIVNEHSKAFRTHSKTQRKWLRLQSKKEVYQLDVELDQIVTYYRTSLSHLCAYFIQHFLGGEPISLLMFLHRVCHIQAEIKESKDERMVVLQENKKDPRMMMQLQQAIAKLNDLKIEDNRGKVYRFSIN